MVWDWEEVSALLGVNLLEEEEKEEEDKDEDDDDDDDFHQ